MRWFRTWRGDEDDRRRDNERGADDEAGDRAVLRRLRCGAIAAAIGLARHAVGEANGVVVPALGGVVPDDIRGDAAEQAKHAEHFTDGSDRDPFERDFTARGAALAAGDDCGRGARDLWGG